MPKYELETAGACPGYYRMQILHKENGIGHETLPIWVSRCHSWWWPTAIWLGFQLSFKNNGNKDCTNPWAMNIVTFSKKKEKDSTYNGLVERGTKLHIYSSFFFPNVYLYKDYKENIPGCTFGQKEPTFQCPHTHTHTTKKKKYSSDKFLKKYISNRIL